MTQPPRLAGHAIVEALIAQGTDLVFGVPGESYLALLDGLHGKADQIKFISCRHEGGASFMAEAHGKLTGRPGVCLVTRGPGATNASIGLHTAFQDSTPMILLIGQVARGMVEREAFQEVDYRRMFGQMAKWVAQIDDARRIPEFISRAYHTALSGRPGPVVLALPEDMLVEEVTAPAPATPALAVQASPARSDVERLFAMLGDAERPILLLGGTCWDSEAVARLKLFVQANELPVACTFRFQDLFDNAHPNYLGDVGLGVNPRLADRIRNADLVIALGARLGECTTGGYTLLEVPRPRQRLIHIHAGAEELGRVYHADLMINSGMREFSAALAAHEPVSDCRWRGHAVEGRRDYEEWTARKQMPGAVQLWDVVSWLQDHVPDDTIVTNGAGNYTVWLHRFWRHRKFRTQLAPISGAMGYGVPAAIAAKIAQPSRTVIAFAGDGCFLMTGQELATAVLHDARVIFIVVNNGMYGTIRMHQEREYPGKVIGTKLANPDFAAYARSFGLHGETVVATAEFPAAFTRSVESGKPALIEVVIDPQAITPNATLDGLREQALRQHSR